MYIYDHVNTYIVVYVYMNIYIYVHISISVHVYMHTYIHAYIYAYISVYIICLYIYTATFAYPPRSKEEQKDNSPLFFLSGVGGCRTLWAAGQAHDTWEHTAVMTTAPLGAKA